MVEELDWTQLHGEERDKARRAAYHKKRYQENREQELIRVNAYNAEHREERRAYNHEYDATHKEQRKEYERNRYQEHRDEILARCRRWFAEHKEEKRLYDRAHYQANLEKIQAYHRQYFKDHPELNRIYRENRRARELGQEDQFTPVEWLAKQEEYDNKCAYCGTRDIETPEGFLVPDHAIPLARGGSGHIDNIIPACKACNDAKHTLTARQFFFSIEIGHEEDVLVRRYINEHPEEIERLLEGADNG